MSVVLILFLRGYTVMKNKVKRGDLYYAILDPIIGSEQGGTRPVLVVQNNIGNRFSPTTIVVAAITSRTDKTPLPTHVRLECVPGLERNSLLLLEQIRTIDRKRLKGYIGALDEHLMAKVDQALSISMGLLFENSGQK